MVDQAQMNEEDTVQYESAQGNRRGGLAHDIVALVELQTQLFLSNCKESVSRLVAAAFAAIAALALILGSIPLLLTAFAHLVAWLFGMSIGWGFMIAAAAGFGAAAGLAFWGWWSIRHAGRAFAGSGKEFSRNWTWFKDMLKATSTTKGNHDSQ